MATQKEVAAHLDLSDRSIRELVTRGILPRPRGRGGYKLDTCRRAYIRHLRDVAAGHKSKDGKLDLVTERARLAKEQADGQEMKNAQLRGEQIPCDAVVSTWQEMFIAAKTTFRGVKAKLRMQFPDLSREVLESIADVHDAALSELAGDGLPAGAGEDPEA